MSITIRYAECTDYDRWVLEIDGEHLADLPGTAVDPQSAQRGAAGVLARTEAVLVWRHAHLAEHGDYVLEESA